MTAMERWTQIAFQYRDDDGTEVTATDRQAVNVNDTLDLDTNFRMRIGVQGNHSAAANFDLTVGFQYNVALAGWNDITTTSANVRAVGSANFTDDDATTEQLAQSKTFVAGHMDDDGSSPAVSISDTEESEFEICFQLRSAELSGGEAVEIRIVDSGSALTTYTQTPSITVASAGGGGGDGTDMPWPAPVVPVLSKPLVLAAGGLIDPSPLLQQVPIDQWWSPASEPTRVVPRSLAALLADGAFQEYVSGEAPSHSHEPIVGVVFSSYPTRIG